MGTSRSRSRSHGWTAWLCGVVIVGTGLSGTLAGAASPTVPSAPTITSVTAGLHSVTVAFAPTSDGGAPILSYRVKCTSTNGGVPGSHDGPTSPIGVAGVTSADGYSCTVAASNRKGVGPPSAPSARVVTLPIVPAAPRITSMTAGWHSVTVAFAPTSDGGARILTYVVSCLTDYGPRSHQAVTSPITIACLEGANTYICTVAAENRVGWSRSSAPSSPTVSLPTLPAPPTITSAAPGLHSMTVAFAKPADDGGAPITDYRVTCTSPNGGIVNAHQSSNSPITVAGLTAAKIYTCTVAAMNEVGTGPVSTLSAPVVALPTAAGSADDHRRDSRTTQYLGHVHETCQ